MCCISFYSSIVICIILQISLLSTQWFIVFCTSYSPKYCFPYSMILIEIPCSICMFIKHTVFLSLFLHFTIQSSQIIGFFLPFMLIPFLFMSFYFNDYAHWVLFHGMLLSIIHSQPMIILLLLECFLHRLNDSQQSSILHSWTDSCHYYTLIAITINIWSTIVFIPHSNTPNICKLSQATHFIYHSDYFPITIHSSHTSNTSSIPQILQLSLVFQQTILNTHTP